MEKHIIIDKEETNDCVCDACFKELKGTYAFKYQNNTILCIDCHLYGQGKDL